jgi:hypothetical protein
VPQPGAAFSVDGLPQISKGIPRFHLIKTPLFGGSKQRANRRKRTSAVQFACVLYLLPFFESKVFQKITLPSETRVMASLTAA